MNCLKLIVMTKSSACITSNTRWLCFDKSNVTSTNNKKYNSSVWQCC